MKFAILGGSFNPVHVGHLFLADAVLAGFGYDRIILVPTYQSPFKIGAQGGSPQDRIDLLAASIPGDPRLTIDICEIKREGVSYTIDTIKDIIKRYRPEGKPGLILGDDLAKDFPKWNHAEEIIALADIIIARRISSGETVFSYAHKQLKNEIIEVSSAHIRDQIQKQGAWRYLVPAGACAIIEDRGLYGYTPAYSAQSPGNFNPTQSLIVRIEDAARTALSPFRFFHSRNTAVLCWDLCIRFGLVPEAGYLAGISHDICKSLTAEEMLVLARKDGAELSKLEQKAPSLLHGRAAAVVLQEQFGITDKDVLEAVRLHTTGDMEMGSLAKVLYIADKIEISREDTDPMLRELSLTADLDQLFKAVLKETVAYLHAQNMEVSEKTRYLLEVIHNKD